MNRFTLSHAYAAKGGDQYSADAPTEAGDYTVKASIGDSVTVLRSQAFANCPKLKHIYIPGTVQEIPDDLLKGCKSVTVYGSSKVAKAFAEKNGFKFVEVK